MSKISSRLEPDKRSSLLRGGFSSGLVGNGDFVQCRKFIHMPIYQQEKKMTSASEIIKETVKEKGDEPIDVIQEELKRRFSEQGLPVPLGVEEVDRESRVNPDCNNYGNLEGRFKYRVNHGDGTYSDPWWTSWKCL